MHEKYHNVCLTVNATVQIQRTRFVTMEMPIKGSWHSFPDCRYSNPLFDVGLYRSM